MKKLNAGYSYVTCYKVTKTEVNRVDIATCKEPKETLSSFYNRQGTKPDILMNGGFFGMKNGFPCFNLLDEGVKKAVDNNLKWGFGIDKAGSMYAGSIDNINFKDFISGYPVLISQGKANKITYGTEINYAAPRSIIGSNDTDYFFVTIDGRRVGKPGMNFSQMQALCLKLGMTNAINLDGGGSTRMLYKGAVANSPTENRAVDNVLAVYLNKVNQPPAPTPPSTSNTDERIYTVKAGDSLWKIAQNEMGNGAKYPQLATYNNIKTNHILNTGMKLKIPGNKPSISIPTYTTYAVVKGDSLWSVANKTLKNGDRWGEIKTLNNMSSNVIYTGQILKIPV